VRPFPLARAQSEREHPRSPQNRLLLAQTDHSYQFSDIPLYQKHIAVHRAFQCRFSETITLEFIIGIVLGVIRMIFSSLTSSFRLLCVSSFVCRDWADLYQRILFAYVVLGTYQRLV
jgi:hypothetical protein